MADDRGGTDQASMSATTACEQVSRVERAPGGLPRLPRDGADQVRPCLWPAALEVQGPGLRSAVHAHHAAWHARRGEAARDRALLPGPVDERGSQARRGLGAEHAALGPGSRARPQSQARAGAGRHGGGRDRRGLALRQKKSRKLWIWKAFERGTGRLIDGECGGRDQGTLDRLLKRLERWGVRLFCTDD